MINNFFYNCVNSKDIRKYLNSPLLCRVNNESIIANEMELLSICSL